MMSVAASTGAIGIEIALAIVVGYLGGQWVDRRFHTEPWFQYIGLVAGVGAAIKALSRVIRQYKKTIADEDKKKSPDA